MDNAIDRGRNLFLFCQGMLVAGLFPMKWMEPELVYNNEKISIAGLELFYPKEKLVEILSGIDNKFRRYLAII